MRVLVTGADGFVGRWLTGELEQYGHELVGAETRCDVTDGEAVSTIVSRTVPDAVAHLAAISSTTRAAVDPGLAMNVAVGGTINILEAVRRMPNPAVVLVTGSSEVYGCVSSDALPVHEGQPLAPATPYALCKAAQESVALAYAARFELRVVVTRSFSHIGPGQDARFVVPAMAERVRKLASGEAEAIRVGNIDIRRDLTDVRDVVEAYRLLLEHVSAGDIAAGGLALNVCSGRSVTIRAVIEELCRLAGVEARTRVDPELVRPVDAPDVRGDPSLLHSLTGWHAHTPLARTIADIWAGSASPVVPAALAPN